MSKSTKRKRKMSASKRNLLVDVGLAAGFLTVFNQEITGDTLHEWLALALMVGIIAHLALHWKWIVNITKRIFNPKLPRKTRISYGLNIGLFAAFFGMGVSGMMISEAIMPTFGLGNGGGIWEDVHEAISNGALVLVLSHLLLHFKWIKTNVTKHFYRPIQKRLQTA